MNLKKAYPISMAIIPVLFIGIFFILPSTIGYFYAFSDWNQYTSDLNFVGFANFLEIFQNRSLTTAFINTVIFATVKTVGVTVLGFVFAIPLNRALKTKNLLRTIYFIPAVFSALVVGLIFNGLFDYRNGIVNLTLIALDLENLTQQWLGLKMFDLVYVLTGGGPGYDTETFGTLIMNEMSKGRYAQSVAINLIFTIMLVIVSVWYQKFNAKWEDM